MIVEIYLHNINLAQFFKKVEVPVIPGELGGKEGESRSPNTTECSGVCCDGFQEIMASSSTKAKKNKTSGMAQPTFKRARLILPIRKDSIYCLASSQIQARYKDLLKQHLNFRTHT